MIAVFVMVGRGELGAAEVRALREDVQRLTGQVKLLSTRHDGLWAQLPRLVRGHVAEIPTAAAIVGFILLNS
jgi:hypothetical protein